MPSTAPGREPGYRWVVLVAAAVMLAVAMGQLVNGLSVYFIPLEQAFGWPRADVALINTFGLIGVGAGGIVVGRLVDRVGVRRVALAGAVALGLCVALAASASALWQLLALSFAAGFLGGGALFAPLIALVGNWFRVGGGLAIGIASAGQAIGQGGVPFGTSFLIASLGWRGAMLTQGIVSLLVLVPLALLLRDPPGQRPAAAGAAAEPPPPLPPRLAVPGLSLAVLGCCSCMAVPLMHLVPLIEGRGIPAVDASGVLFSMLVVAIAGRVAFGALADRIGAIPSYMTASLWQTVLVFFFTQIQSLGGFYAFAVLYGFGYAGVMTGVLVTARELTPPSRRASLMGVILAFAWLGHAVGGFQAGLFYDLTGDYTVSYANAAAAGVFNLALMGTMLWLIRRRPRMLAVAR
jgi:MFS family permease